MRKLIFIAATWAWLGTAPILLAAEANASSTNSTARKSVFNRDSLEENQTIQWLEQTLGQKVFGISLWQFVFAFLVIVIGALVRRLLQNYVESKLAALFEKTKATWDDLLFEAIRRPLNAFIMVGAIHISAFILVFNIESFPDDFIGKSYTVGLGIIIIWGIYRLVDVVAHYLDELLSKGDTEMK